MSDRATRLHDTPWQGVFYLAGGGTSLIGEMLGTPGASRTVMDVRIPYASAAMTDRASSGRTSNASRIVRRA